MKKIINKTSLIAGAALFAASLPASAQYDDNSGLYLSAFAGLSFQDSQDNESLTGLNDIDVSFDTGFSIGGSIGYKFSADTLPGLRVELEASYRENDSDNGSFAAGFDTFSGDNSSFGVLANVLYDFDNVSESFTPYVGLGAGLGGVESDTVISSSTQGTTLQFGGSTRTRFLWQAIVGFTIPLSDSFDLFVDGRYFDAPGVNFDLVGEQGDLNEFESSFTTYQVQTGVRFKF